MPSEVSMSGADQVRTLQELERELAEAREQQAATASILKVISRSPGDPQRVFADIAANAARLCDAYDAVILQVAGGDILRVVAHHGPIQPADTLPLTRGIVTGRAVLDRQTIQVPDLHAEADEYPEGSDRGRRIGYRTILSAPLIRAGEAIGAIALRRNEVRPFTDRQLELLTIFADQAVIAIENARLLNDVRGSLQQQTAISDVLKLISHSTFDLQTVFRTVAESACRLCAAEHAFVYRFDGRLLRVVVAHNASPELRVFAEQNPLIPGRHSGAARAALERRTIHIHDVQADPEYIFGAKDLSLRTLLAVPMQKAHELLGVILIYRNEVLPFNESQVALMETFAHEAVIAIENTRLLDEVQHNNAALTSTNAQLAQALEQQTATSDVLQVISRTTFDLQPVLDTLVETAARLCNAEGSGIALRCGECFQYAALYASYGIEEYSTFLRQRTFTPGRDTTIGRVALTGDVVHIADIAADQEYALPQSSSLGKIRTNLGVPLLRDGAVIGMLTLFRQHVEPFTDRLIDLVKTFADQAVIAIENTRLFDELQARNRALTGANIQLSDALEQQTATGRILRVISGSPTDVQPVFESVVESAARLCDAERALIYRFDGAFLRLAASHKASAALIEFIKQNPIPPGRQSNSARAALERHTVHIPDAQADAEYTSGMRNVDPIRSTVAVPMLKGDVLLGVIVIYRLEVRPFTHKQISLVETFADQAAIAISNVGLFDEVQTRNRELRTALEQQTATSQILGVISRSPTDVQPVFAAIAESAVRLCGANYGSTMRLDGDVMTLVAHKGQSEHWLETVSRLFPQRLTRDLIAGSAIMDREIVHVTDMQSDPRFPTSRKLARTMGYRTALCVPMLRDRAPIGAILVFRQAAQPFSEGQISLLRTFADQAVIAIENTRLFEAEQASKRELQESLEYQTAISDVLGVISRSPNELQPVLDVIVETAVRLCQADVADFRLLRDGLYHIAATTVNEPTRLETLRDNPIAPGRSSVVGRVALERRTIHVPDMQADPEYTYAPGPNVPGMRAILGVPLLRDGAVIGAIVLFNGIVKPFTQKQIALVSTFANQALIAIENARLFEAEQASKRELQETLQYQTATAEVLSVISSSPNQLQPVLDVITQTAAQLCQADYAHFRILRDGAYHVASSKNYDPLTLQRLTPIAPGPGSIAGRVALECKTVHLPDILTDATGEYTRQHGELARTGLGVPLMKDAMVVGVIMLFRKNMRAFTERQIALVNTFAEQALIAMENTRLFEEVQARNRDLSEALEQQTATSEVLKVIGRSTFDLQPVLETLVENAARLCGASVGAIFRLDGEVLRWVADYGATVLHREFQQRNPIRRGRGSSIGRAALYNQTVHIIDAMVDPEFEHAEAQKTGNFRTLLGVPMLRGGVLLGVFSLQKREVQPFTKKQIELVETFADQAVIAIENVRLLEEAQTRTRELARSVQELEALGEVGRAVSSTLDLKIVLKTIVDRAVHLSSTDAGSIFYYRKELGIFELGETTGLSDEFVARLQKLDIFASESGLGEAIGKREPLQVPDLKQRPSEPLRDAVLEAGFRASLIVPLLGAEEPLGTLILRRRQSGEFSPAVVRLMQSFADQSAIALENARLFDEIAQKSRELEIASQHKSQFVANMSHELRTPLAAILGYAELMQEGFYEPLGQKSMDALTRIRSNGKHLLGLINTVLDIAKIESGQFTLNMTEYAIESVVETVRSATESLAQNKKLALNTEVAKSLPIGLGDEQRLTQVLLNLVGNAIKFTDSGEVRVTAKAINGRFNVSVTDTGPGIPAGHQMRIFEQFHQVDSSNTKAKGGTGLGLAIAKQIVEMHGGRIWVESTVGKGSTFQMELPTRAEFRKSGP